MPANTTFYQYRLTMLTDCRRYGLCKHAAVRINGYYYNGHWFIDYERSVSFQACATEIRHARNPNWRYIIYSIQNWFDYSDLEFVSSMEQLNEDIVGNFTFLPEIEVVQGPNGENDTLARNLTSLKGAAVLAAAEIEQTNLAYSDSFFFRLNNAITVNIPIIYVQLNGWHVQNMPNLMHLNLEVIKGGIIIYLELAAAHYIGVDTIKRKLPQVDVFPYIYDTKGAKSEYQFPWVVCRGNTAIGVSFITILLNVLIICNL